MDEHSQRKTELIHELLIINNIYGINGNVFFCYNLEAKKWI